MGASKPEDYGDHFAWGETKTKDVYYWDTYKHAKGIDKLTKYCGESDYGYKGFADTLTELQPIDDPATANWGNGWYTPKKEQWDELMAHTNIEWAQRRLLATDGNPKLMEHTNIEWTTRNGVVGWLFTSRRNGKDLFLPAAGYWWESEFNGADLGVYWSVTLNKEFPYRAWGFHFNSSQCHLCGSSDRNRGQTVRAVVGRDDL